MLIPVFHQLGYFDVDYGFCGGDNVLRSDTQYSVIDCDPPQIDHRSPNSTPYQKEGWSNQRRLQRFETAESRKATAEVWVENSIIMVRIFITVILRSGSVAPCNWTEKAGLRDRAQ